MRVKSVLLHFVAVFCLSSFVFAQTENEAYSLYSKGGEYFNAGKYDIAISYYTKAIPIYENVYGQNHIFTADVYQDCGVANYNLGNYQKAIQWLKKSCAIYTSPNNNQEKRKNSIAYSLGCIASSYFKISNYDNAMDYRLQELDYRKKYFGENNNETANCYRNLGLIYEFRCDYKTALSYYQKALKIRLKLFGENSLESAASYHDIAVANYMLGNYQDSIDCFCKKVLKIRERIKGQNSIEVADTLQALTSIYIDCDSFDDALEAFNTIESIYSNIQINPISPNYAVLYNEKGRLYEYKYDLTNALFCYKKFLEINEKLYGEKYVHTASAYNNIGDIYFLMGDYSRARANFEKALEIAKSIFGNSHKDVALYYRNLGKIYDIQDDYDTAAFYFQKAADVNKSVFGEKNNEVARCYMSLGGVYESKKDLHKALDYYVRANEIIYDLFGYETIDLAESYERIAGIYDEIEIGKHDEAEHLYNAALKFYNRFFGEDSLQSALIYHSLGWHYSVQNDKKLALENFKKSHAGFKKSTNYVLVIEALSRILQSPQLNNSDSDSGFIRDTIQLATDTVEHARLDMNSLNSSLLQESLPIYYYGVDFEARNNNPAKAFEYSEMLRSRGFLEQIGLERAISLDGITEKERGQVKRLTSEITSARKQIERQNNLPKAECDSKKLTAAEKNLAAAEKSLAKLDESIGKRVIGYAELRSPKTAKASDVQKWCSKSQAILEYVLYEGDDKNQKKFSYCIVVTNKKILTVTLDSSYDYNSAISSLRNAITHRPIKSEVTFEKQRNELYEKLVQPVLPYIKGVKDVLIVPDGNLSFLPFDMLREDSDSDDFGKRYAISISPSISVSMIADKVKSNSTGALLFGGAWYDKSLSEEEHNQTLRGNGKRGKDRGFVAPGRRINLSVKDLQNILKNEGAAQYFAQKKLDWHDLPGTIVELETLRKATFPKAQVETQKAASEATLKKMSKDGLLSKYSTVHFACHGYFDPDLSEMSSVLFSEVSGKLTESDDDGYLTIGEAATLNLSAQMVCLSACQTGLGEVKKGEGMVGLSRAFMVAGAKNVGVTLWCVDDEATARFMSKMYRWVNSGLSYPDAYRRVKNEFRTSDDYNHPYYWAAFVVYE